MSFARNLLSFISLLLLAGGYAASQWAFFQNQAPEYARRIDTPPVKVLALILLILAMIFAFIPDKEPAPDQK